MSDDAFHEISLKGKQLVFLFMAATVVAVVVFLCGVMVGRGVTAPRNGLVETGVETSSDPTAGEDDPPPSVAPSAVTGALPSAQEALSYPDRLSGESPAAETIQAEEATPVTDVPVAAEAVRQADRAAPAPAEGARPDTGSPFTVQVAAIREQAEAERMAERLAAKGYAAYVAMPREGAPRVYRVRVGTFTDRREAEAVAGRLEREEQVKPWITR